MAMGCLAAAGGAAAAAATAGHASRTPRRASSAQGLDVLPVPGTPPAARMSKPLTQTFVTEPGFKAPIVNMSVKDTDTASGDIFLDAESSGQNAAYILNPQGKLLWYRPAPAGLVAHDVRVQSYRGNPVLTCWQGKLIAPGAGRGEGMILNHHYQTIHRVTPGNGLKSLGADEHE